MAAEEKDPEDIVDDDLVPDSKGVESLPQASDETVEVIDTALKSFTPKFIIIYLHSETANNN